MSYSVETNVPIPAPARRPSKYPFASMALGDSFGVPLDPRGVAAAAAAASYFTSRNPGVSFSRRQDKGAGLTRFWRTS
jgi:hypothetical protein